LETVGWERTEKVFETGFVTLDGEIFQRWEAIVLDGVEGNSVWPRFVDEVVRSLWVG
jgi:hypothetical protein